MAPRRTEHPHRRQRVREATLEEIRSTARRLLVERGSAAVTINAVAREMGMSGPALYRYYASHNDLVAAVTDEFFAELTRAMTTARDAHPPSDRVGGSDRSIARRLVSTCRAMRAWVVAHPAEFGWLFASPVASRQGPDRERSVQGFERVFLDQFVDLWESKGFPVPSLTDLTPSHRRQLRAYTRRIDGRMPPEAAHVYLSCWIRLYGLLCMEVMHQLDFAYTDLEPVFEECLRELAERLGLDYVRPGRT